MGIRNLNKWIDWVGRRGVRIVDWSQFRGERVGIDVLSFIYRSKQLSTSPLLTVIQLVRDMRQYAIEPIFVFDGKTPPEKIAARRSPTFPTSSSSPPSSPRVSADDRNLVKTFLYTCGVLALNAEHEADSVLAVMERSGMIAAVISSDTDFLARGIRHLIIPPATGAVESCHWKYIHLPTLLEEAGISYDRFVGMCVLLGCDYTPALPTVSYQSAYWTMRRGGGGGGGPVSAEEVLRAVLQREGIRTTTVWESAVETLRGDRETWESVLAPKQRDKWAAGAPPPEEAELRSMLEILEFPATPADLLPPTNRASNSSSSNCRSEFGCGGATAAPYHYPECSYC